MPYAVLEKSYATLTAEQQAIVYNLVLSLEKMNERQSAQPKKREFGKFKGKATAEFSDDWEMSEAELCGL